MHRKIYGMSLEIFSWYNNINYWHIRTIASIGTVC